MKIASRCSIKIIALVLVAMIIYACSFTGAYSVTAAGGANDAFELAGQTTYAEIDNECYQVSLKPWAAAKTSRQVDLIKGFYFTIDGFISNSDWLRIYFLKDLESSEAYSSDVKIRYADGTMWCDELDEGSVRFSTPFYASDMVHFMQARPVKNGDAVEGYQLYIDGKPFNSNGFSISVENFNKYNNYNEQTGEFDGCHLQLMSLNTPTVCISYPTADRFTGSVDGFSYIENTDGFDDITLGEGGRANSTWQFDLLDGVKFSLDDLEENNNSDFVTVGISNDLWKLRLSNAKSSMAYSFRLKNVDGNLAISVFDGEKYGDFKDHKVSAAKNLTLKAVETSIDDQLIYKFYLGGREISGFDMTEDEFYEFNYSFGGAYIGFNANKGATVRNVCKAVLGENPFTETMNFSSVNKNGSYDMKLGAQGIAVTNWQVDLTKGIFFSIDDFTNNDGADWLQMMFLADSKNSGEVYPTAVMLKHRDNQLYGSATDGKGEWCNTLFGAPIGTHFLQAKRVLTGDGSYVYRLYIDGKDFSGTFNIPEESFKALNNYNEADETFAGMHLKFRASKGAKLSVFVPGDAAFAGEEGFEYTASKDEKYNLELKDGSYAISTWNAEISEGVSFTLEKLEGVLSVRLANNMWTMTREDGIPSKNCQPLIKLKEENGALYASVSNDDETESYKKLEGVSVAGEHVLNVKPEFAENPHGTVYRVYLDDVEIDNSYTLSSDEFALINNYDAITDTYLGATVRFASTKAVKINNIYKTVAFEGVNFNYREISDDHYNLNIRPYSYAISKWKTDLTQGISFTVDSIKGWIMIRFSSSFEKMNTGLPGQEVNTYQPLMLLRNDPDGLYVAMMSGYTHKSGTKLNGVSLLGTHILTAKLAPDVTGVLCYRFYLDGMPIVTGYTMSQSVMKRINGYNKDTDNFEGTHVFFGSESGVTINDIHRLTVGEAVKNEIWDTASKAKVSKVNDSTYNMELPAFSSLRSSSAVDMEKGITLNAQSGDDFGIALSMLPAGTTLDVPPVITDTNGIYYSFKKTDANTYRIVSSTGLVADYSGDLSGSHTYSMVKITDIRGKEKYTLAIDGKAVFTDGMEKNDYIKFSNGSSGSYPTVFARTDDKIQISGAFKKVDSINTDNLWDDDWSGDTDDWYEEDENEDFLDDWDEELSWDEEEEIEEEESSPTTKRVLVKRVKIEQEPIVKYVMNWWLVVIAAAAILLIAGGIITFMPSKKNKEEDGKNT